MTQPEDILFGSDTSDQDSAALIGLLDLLLDLKIVDSPPAITAAEPHRIDNDHLVAIVHQAPECSTQLPFSDGGAILESQDHSTDLHTSVQLNEVYEHPKSTIPNGINCGSQLSQSETYSPEDGIAALERLQSLLVEPELAEFRPLVQTLEQKLSDLEHQIYDPAELIKLLLPWVAELLSRKVTESQEEIVQAIAPIIDRVIENRAEQDKAAMAAALAPVISGAISQQTARSPQEVARAIAPMMGRAIQEQIRLERDAMVDALYPVIGSTIAKYMAEAIQAINQKIENTFSVEGIQRKIRARLQGVSEAELILKEAIPFTVQAVFLIHKISGLIISEVQQRDSQSLEADMVAGMLTAIRSFANDCITQPGTVSELNEINYGNSKIILEVAGYCYLAIVIQGEPSRRFITTMRQTLITLIQQHGQEIAGFEGDPDRMPAVVNTLLEDLRDVESSETSSHRKQPPPLLIAAIAALGAISTFWGIHQYQNHLDLQVESHTATALANAPELAVYRLTVEAHRGTLKLSGKVPNSVLRQKAAQIARSTTPDWLLNNQIQAVEVPADPVLAAAEVKRLTRTLNQMEGTAITAQYANETVTVRGRVSRVASATAIAQAFEHIPGVRSVSSAVQVQPLKIDVRFYFAVGSIQINAIDQGYKFYIVRSFLNQHPEKSVRIVGYSNPISSPTETRSIALQRARAVRDALVNWGISPDRLQVAGSTQYPSGTGIDQPTWLSRCVEIIPTYLR